MHRVRLITAAVLLTLVAACGGGDGDKAKDSNDSKSEGPAKLVKPQGGQCVAKEVADGDDFAPDMRTVVPCNEPHAYEIVSVVAIPDDMLSGTTDAEKLARRTELNDINNKESALRKRLKGEVYSLCDEPFREATGLGQLTVVGKPAKDVDLQVPFGPASEWDSLTPPDLWVNGTAQAVCSYRFGPPTEDGVVSPVTPIRSNNTNPAMSSFLSRKLPAALRACMDNKSNNSIACTSPHDQELLWVIDMKAVYGKDFLKGAKLTDVSDADFNKLLDACIDPYQQSGGGLTEKIGMGFRFFSDVPTTGTTLPIICVLASRTGETLDDVVAYDRFD
jgi:hypothetical protein